MYTAIQFVKRFISVGLLFIVFLIPTNAQNSKAFKNAVSKPCGTDKEFVRSLYQSILERDIEVSFAPGQGAVHLQSLQNGESRWKIIWSFFNSPEYLNKHKSHLEFIKDAYQSILGRQAKTRETKFWPDINRNDILRKFFNSEEYINLMANCPDIKHKTNFVSIAGQWNLTQDNGYTGTMTLQQNQFGKLSGTAIWNGYLKGTINGKILDNAIEFNINYPSGDIGLYKGTLTQNGIRIINGTVKGNNGVSANWNALKSVSSPNNNTYSTNNAISKNIQPWVIGLTYKIHYGTGSVWVEESGGGIGKDIAIDAFGNPWVIGSDNGIYYHNGNRWIQYPGSGKGIAISVAANGTPWIIGMDNHIYYGAGTKWVEQPGGGIGKDIAIDAFGNPWVIGSDNGIYYHNGIKWVEYPGNGQALAISISQDGTPWIIGMDNHIYHGTGTKWVEESGGGIGKDIAIDAFGNPWVIGSDNGIYYHNGNRWIQYPGGGKGYKIIIAQ
ncbi:MAG: hypothetical protein DRI74_05885 [Bacteroidetes bacterium]|nr:MAG: hypothetical protein DRI74_05885 [Bacteroidota bacterium]